MNFTISNNDSSIFHFAICGAAIIGIIGNLLLLLVIVSCRRSLDPTYMYIANIAASDLCTSLQTFIVNVVFAIKVKLKYDDWIIFCKILLSIFLFLYLHHRLVYWQLAYVD